MLEFISQPWPWYVAGPIIGLVVPVLLLLGNRQFGVSENLRHMCAATVGNVEFLRYDWRAGKWNLTFAVGTVIGGFLAYTFLSHPDPIAISEATRSDLAALGISDFNGLVPVEIFSWSGLGTFTGIVMILVGGFLVGFGSRYAGGCTSGHAISGLANLQLPSLIAVLGFFAGGLIATYFILPILM
ncbi:MAG: YeeE/YedE thiosulfate transporter family protein [Rhodothermales bacterium]|nr:YeeE/YedE thiosulfate transporter family protein [Rhodothermales bacterium]